MLYTRKLQQISTERQVMNTHIPYKENKSTNSWHEFDYETCPRIQFKIIYYY